MAENDLRGWLLVHRQIRGEIADQSAQLRALLAGDTEAATALQRWWESLSTSIAHHMRSEDDRIWPQLRAIAPAASEPLAGLETEHRELLDLLGTVDRETSDLAGRVAGDDFSARRDALVRLVDDLGRRIRAHLDREEALVAPLFSSALSPAEWHRLEQDMVKGLSPREMAGLLPRMLSYADSDTRAMMLATRVPAPVRLLDRLVFEPRYRRTRARLPLGR